MIGFTLKTVILFPFLAVLCSYVLWNQKSINYLSWTLTEMGSHSGMFLLRYLTGKLVGSCQGLSMSIVRTPWRLSLWIYCSHSVQCVRLRLESTVDHAQESLPSAAAHLRLCWNLWDHKHLKVSTDEHGWVSVSYENRLGRPSLGAAMSKIDFSKIVPRLYMNSMYSRQLLVRTWSGKREHAFICLPIAIWKGREIYFQSKNSSLDTCFLS